MISRRSVVHSQLLFHVLKLGLRGPVFSFPERKWAEMRAPYPYASPAGRAQWPKGKSFGPDHDDRDGMMNDRQFCGAECRALWVRGRAALLQTVLRQTGSRCRFAFSAGAGVFRGSRARRRRFRSGRWTPARSASFMPLLEAGNALAEIAHHFRDRRPRPNRTRNDQRDDEGFYARYRYSWGETSLVFVVRLPLGIGEPSRLRPTTRLFGSRRCGCKKGGGP